MAVATEMETAIKTKCAALGSGLATTGGFSATDHANAVAGTKGWPLVGALNKIAGNPKTQYREHDGVLNQLAGTSGWGANAAASRWAGLI